MLCPVVCWTGGYDRHRSHKHREPPYALLPLCRDVLSKAQLRGTWPRQCAISLFTTAQTTLAGSGVISLQREASHSPVWGDTEAAQACTHCALVRLLARMSSHVHNQHVLGFEGFLLSWTIKPTTHKFLLFAMNVVIIDMLRLTKRERKSKRISHFSTQQKEVKVCSTFKSRGHTYSFMTSQFKRHLVHTFLDRLADANCVARMGDTIVDLASRKNTWDWNLNSRGQVWVAQSACKTGWAALCPLFSTGPPHRSAAVLSLVCVLCACARTHQEHTCTGIP